MANAVFYNNLYLLLPEEYPDYESFMAYLNQAAFPLDVKMVNLQEDHKIISWNIVKGVSLAPYFLTGFHDEPSTIRFAGPEGVFPVSVELLDQDSYNARLREVINGYCEGCKRFKPLSNRVQSLNGHHQEITLDGVCFFRYEENPSPRIFKAFLAHLGGCFRGNHAWGNPFDIDVMKDRLNHVYLRYKSLSSRKENGVTVYTAECKKGELLSPVLTSYVSTYLESVVSENLRIEAVNYKIPTESSLLTLLSTENQEKFRKECKKYGVCFGVLEFNPEMQHLIEESLEELEDHFYMEPLVILTGKIYCLITFKSYVLKELHYRTPLLEKAGTTLKLYTQSEDRKYRISFAMESEPIE